MKRSWNTLFQVLATSTQLLNLYSPIIPPKYLGLTAAILSAIQGTAAVIAHSFNPDGTAAVLPYVPPQK
jgi:hypothetical protein